MNASWTRLVLVALTLAAATAASLQIGPGALLSWMKNEEKRRVDGAMIVVASSEHGLDATVCERIALTTTVVGSGSLSIRALGMARPGVPAPIADVSPGFLRLLRVSDPGRIVDDPPIEQIGQSLATELHVPPADSTDFVIADAGQRTADITAAVIRVVPPTASADECWIETEPAAFTHAVDLAISTFALTTGDLKVHQLAFDGGPRSFDAGGPTSAVLAIATLVMLSIAISARARRVDIAMYRLVGMSSRAARTIVLTEMTIVTAAGVSAGGLAWLVDVWRHGSLPRNVLVGAGATILLIGWCSSAAAALMALVLGRRSTQLEALREGA